MEHNRPRTVRPIMEAVVIPTSKCPDFVLDDTLVTKSAI